LTFNGSGVFGTAVSAGTALKVNTASGFGGTLLDLQVSGSSKFSVGNAGAVTEAGALTVSGGGASITGNSTITGTLTSLTGLTSSGTVTFSGLSTLGVVHNTAAGVLSTSLLTSADFNSATLYSNITQVGALTAGSLGAGFTAVNVAQGGTGLTTTTAYGVLTGGTTATGAFQNVGAGSVGQVLVSNGAGALPSWSSSASCGNCLVQVPGTTLANTVAPTASVVSLTVKETSGAAADILDLQTSGGANLVSVNSTGLLTATAGLTLTGATNINTNGSAATTNIGTGAAAETVALGSTNTTSTTTINAGSGDLVLGGTATTIVAGTLGNNVNLFNTTTGTISIGTGAANSINIGTGAFVENAALGSTNTTSTTTINAGSGGLILGGGATTIVAGTLGNNVNLFNTTTGTISIGTGAANTINIGTGAFAGNASLGSTNTTSSTTINAGSGDLILGGTATTIVAGTLGNDVHLFATTTGVISIGNGAANTINIGNGAFVQNVTLGSTNTTSRTTINAGSGDLVLGGTATTVVAGTVANNVSLFATTTGNISIGGDCASCGDVFIGGSTGSTTPSLFFPGIDTNSGLGADPTEADGAMYFSSGNQSFRCGESGAWNDCATLNIQHAYVVQDEFLHCGTASGSIGDLGWNELIFGFSDTVACNTLGGVVDHPGTMNLATSNHSGSGAMYRLSFSGAAPAMVMQQDLDFRTSVLTEDVTNTHTFFGFSNQVTANADGLDPSVAGVWWELDPDRTGMTNSNWHYCYFKGSNSTIVCADTGVAASTTNWAQLEIRFTAGGTSPTAITYYLNGTAYTVSGLASNDLTGAVGPVFGHAATTNSSVAFDIDYVQIRGVTSATR
jgi:hypothetical protein